MLYSFGEQGTRRLHLNYKKKNFQQNQTNICSISLSHFSSASKWCSKICYLVFNMWRHILPFRCNVSRRIFSIAIVHKHGGLFRDGAHICSSNTGKSKINFNQFLINQKIYFPSIINEKCGVCPHHQKKIPQTINGIQ